MEIKSSINHSAISFNSRQRVASPGDLLFASGKLSHNKSSGSGPTFIEQEPDARFNPGVRLMQSKIVRNYSSCFTDTLGGFLSAVNSIMESSECGFHMHVELDGIVSGRQRLIMDMDKTPPWFLLAGPYCQFELIFTVKENNVENMLTAASLVKWYPILLGRTTSDGYLRFPFEGSSLVCKPDEIVNLYIRCEGDTKKYFQSLAQIHRLWILQAALQRSFKNQIAIPDSYWDNFKKIKKILPSNLF